MSKPIYNCCFAVIKKSMEQRISFDCYILDVSFAIEIGCKSENLS